jgi:hypothetical protein
MEGHMTSQKERVPVMLLKNVSSEEAVGTLGPGLVFEIATGAKFALPISLTHLEQLQAVLVELAAFHARTQTKQ